MAASVSLAPLPIWQILNNAGLPNVGGSVLTQVGGVNFPTYQDSAGTTPLPNPIPLNSRGEISNATGVSCQLFLVNGSVYVFTIFDALGNQIDQASYVTPTIGAAAITYTPPGSGTVAEPVATRLNQTFVFDAGYQADLTGATDSTTAFTNFLAACNGIEGEIPGNSTIKLSSTPTIPAGSRILVRNGTTFTGAGATSITAPSNTNLTVQWERAVTASVLSTSARIDHLWENSTFPLSAEVAGLYGQGYVFNGISKQFNSGDIPAGGGSPTVFAFHAFANDNGIGVPVVAVLGDACARVNSSTVFGSNFIARNGAGVTNTHMVCSEFDMQPSVGTTSLNSIAVAINTFSFANVGPAIQLGGIGGGTFTNGILHSAVAGTCMGVQSGATPTTLTDSHNGTYGTAVHYLDSGHFIRWTGTGGTTLVTQNTSGQLLISVASGGAMGVQSAVSTEGTVVAFWETAGANFFAQLFNATGAAGNAANAAQKLNANSVTSRSLNAGGTVNASGTDYAEYETKREELWGDKVAKGQIIGFDVDGLVTDKWALSVTFGVKSTDPNFVGGDDWHQSLGPEPKQPLYPDPDFGPMPVAPTFSIRRFAVDGQKPTEAQVKKAEDLYSEEKTQHESELTAWKQKHADHRTAWEANELAAHLIEKAKFEAALEVERQKVDRIAYCGKVPVNVTGAKIGQWVVPAQNGDGIGALLVDKPDLDQYLIAVGRVRRILPDGRAEIVVKPV